MQVNIIKYRENILFKKQNKDSLSFPKQKDKEDKLLCYALGGLALLAVGAVLYNKKAVLKKTPLIKTTTYQDLRESVSAKRLEEIEQKAAELDNFKLINELKTSHDKDIFKRLVALLHLEKKEAIECPKLITTNASDEKLKEICNFFNSEFKFSSKNLKYNNNTEDFIKLIDKQSNQADTNVCVSIDNFDQFIKDLNKDTTLKQKFFDILDKNNNNVIFIGNVSSKDSIVMSNQIFLPFKV